MAGSGTAPLRLEVREFTDLTRWRWTLTDANGAFLADHEVRLDPQAERFEAFTALHDYVSWHAAPDKRQAEEARIVTGLGDWIGTEVLVTLSACSSAALTAAEQRRLLGLPVKEDQNHSAERPEPSLPGPSSAPGTPATMLADRLGCAVLAMRFPVGDEFAIALAGKLYDLLARQGQPLPRAVAMTLSHLTYHTDRRYPALSMAAPAIFGVTAAGLTLQAPQRTGPVSYATGNLKMAGFPPQPDRFVGRTAVMTRSSLALAAESRVPGVLLHGMPGGGKTACALELAYTHEHAFDRLVWFKAPDEGMAIDGALTDFALTLERDLPGFQMIHVLADDTKLTAFLPQLTELLEQSRLLLVIDNAESLLTDTGQWRDAQWGKLFGALTGHTGYGRVIMTSRRAPAGAPDAIAKNAPAG